MSSNTVFNVSVMFGCTLLTSLFLCECDIRMHSADIAVDERGPECNMLRARLLFYRYVFALNLLVFINVNYDNC